MEPQNVNTENLPLVGFGTSKDKLELVRNAVSYALKVGYRMIDTATFYQNETEVGEGIQEAIGNGVVTREDIYVITKLPPTGAQRVRHFLKKSLRDLKLDYVDLYLIHNPTFFKYDKSDDNLLPVKDGVLEYDYTSYFDVWKDMECCVDEGLCRAIGVSNFNARQLEELWKKSRIKPKNIQVECHIHLQEEGLLRKCKELGVSMTAFAPLGSPSYKNFMATNMGQTLTQYNVVMEEPVLLELATRYKKTPAQIALRWLLQRGVTPIPKSFNEDRIRENFQIFDFSLEDEDMKNISKVNKNTRHFSYKEICPGIEDHPAYAFNELCNR